MHEVRIIRNLRRMNSLEFSNNSFGNFLPKKFYQHLSSYNRETKDFCPLLINYPQRLHSVTLFLNMQFFSLGFECRPFYIKKKTTSLLKLPTVTKIPKHK